MTERFLFEVLVSNGLFSLTNLNCEEIIFIRSYFPRCFEEALNNYLVSFNYLWKNCNDLRQDWTYSSDCLNVKACKSRLEENSLSGNSIQNFEGAEYNKTNSKIINIQEKKDERKDHTTMSLQMTDQSKRGICGLKNLGNTCFLNSGLQCLSFVKELTEYFLVDKYLKEINYTNPLGTNGKVVKEYGILLKHLWYGTSSVYSPQNLKYEIGNFQPLVSIYICYPLIMLLVC